MAQNAIQSENASESPEEEFVIELECGVHGNGAAEVRFYRWDLDK